MNFNERNIFLFDGIGALLSFLFTCLILPLLSNWTGIPQSVSYAMALLPVIYCLYSLSCYWRVRSLKSWMLLLIICANIFYLILSCVLIFAVISTAMPGKILILGEAMVILGVVIIEFKVYRKFYV